jgi:hypothetical protein
MQTPGMTPKTSILPNSTARLTTTPTTTRYREASYPSISSPAGNSVRVDLEEHSLTEDDSQSGQDRESSVSECSSKVKNDFVLAIMCKNIGIYITESTIDDSCYFADLLLLGSGHGILGDNFFVSNPIIETSWKKLSIKY